jgi:hypothetical protein
MWHLIPICKNIIPGPDRDRYIMVSHVIKWCVKLYRPFHLQEREFLRVSDSKRRIQKNSPRALCNWESVEFFLDREKDFRPGFSLLSSISQCHSVSIYWTWVQIMTRPDFLLFIPQLCFSLEYGIFFGSWKKRFEKALKAAIFTVNVVTFFYSLKYWDFIESRVLFYPIAS